METTIYTNNKNAVVGQEVKMKAVGPSCNKAYAECEGVIIGVIDSQIEVRLLKVYSFDLNYKLGSIVDFGISSGGWGYELMVKEWDF